MIYMLVCTVAELPKTPEDASSPPNKEIADFYVRLGMAVAAWQFVESALVHIYAGAIGTFKYQPLFASFHAPTNFNARLEMTDAALRHAGLSKDIISEWDKLYTRTRKKAGRRNAMAHAMVLFEPKRRPGQQLFLSPNVSDPSRFPNDGFSQGSIITQSELETMIDTFSKLQKELQAFSQKLPPVTSLPTSP